MADIKHSNPPHRLQHQDRQPGLLIWLREVLTSFGVSLTKGQKVIGSARSISDIYQN